MKKEIIKSYCTTCDNDNNHKVVFFERVTSDSQDYNCATDYMLISCMGCGTFSFREDFNDYESAYPTENNNWEHPIITTIYPPFLKNHRRLDNSWKLPNSIRTVFQESLYALIADCKILAGAGFRAVIEAICLDREIKGRTLENKINNLAKDGLITKKECERLHSIRFLGNDSIHEIKVPEQKQLIAVLNIVEHILKNIYLIDFEIDKILDIPISDYTIFLKLIARKLNDYKVGDEFPLVNISK